MLLFNMLAEKSSPGFLALLPVFACCLFVTGCSNSPLGAEVAGTITWDGKALQSGSVVFVPSDGKSNNAFGAIDSSGYYFLKSNRTVGLAPGKYRVTVAMYDRVEVTPGERSMAQPKLLTPPKYADVSTSELEYEVVAGKNTIDIELVSEAQP